MPFRNEAEFVRWLGRFAPERAPGLPLGIGDDAALMRPTPGCEFALTTDLSIEGVHFRLELQPAESIGHRAVARSLSDLAAMGARPLAVLVSLTFPRSISRHWLRAFYEGMTRLAGRMSAAIIGGDTAVTDAGPLAVDIVAVGEAKRGQALRRAGARPGDRLFVTGRLGLAARGLELIVAAGAGPKGRAHGEAADHAALAAHLYPEPRCAAGVALATRKLASAAIDVSDGFARDLGRLCEASHCGARVFEERLPIGSAKTDLSQGEGNYHAALHRALHGGEDYELIFTASPRKAAKVPRRIGGIALHPIGEIVAGHKLTLVRRDGSEQALKPAGWDHFRNARER